MQLRPSRRANQRLNELNKHKARDGGKNTRKAHGEEDSAGPKAHISSRLTGG